MLRKIGLCIALLLTIALGIQAAAFAQAPEVVAEGLNNPRGLFIDSDGTLYIAEAGRGGDITAEGAYGPVQVGGTGQIVTVAGGEQRVLVTGLPSQDQGGEVRGTSALAVVGDRLWVVVGQGAASVPLTYSLVGMDKSTLRVTQVVDVLSAEAAQNPDGEIVDSNPVDLGLDGEGRVYIVDAGANTVWRWTDAGLEVFATWSADDNPVPTAIAFGTDGDAYIGFLGGFPFEEGGARVERYSLDGTLVETFTGLTNVVDLAFGADGNLYAVEIGRFGDLGWIPETGRIVQVSAGGVTAVAEGLTMPYGLAQRDDGAWLVTINSAYAPLGSGQVIAVGG